MLGAGGSRGKEVLRRSTVQNFVWALVFAGLVFLGPFRPSGLLGGLLTAAIVGGAVFAYRTWSVEVPPGRDESVRGLVRAGADVVASVSLLVWASLAVSVYLFASLGPWFYGQWTSSVWENGHGLFVPMAMLYFGYRKLRGEGNTAPESSAFGFVFLAAGLLAVVLDATIHTRYLAALGLVISLPGYCLLLLGARRTRKLVLPLCLSLFMIPIPFDFSSQILMRNLTTDGTAWVLELVGIPVYRDFTVLALPRFSVDVTRACSGFATLYAGSFAAVVLAAFAQPFWRKVFLIAAILPVALLANVVRVLSLIVMIRLSGLGVLDTDLHPGSGAVVFVLVVGAVALLAGGSARKAMFR